MLYTFPWKMSNVKQEILRIGFYVNVPSRYLDHGGVEFTPSQRMRKRNELEYVDFLAQPQELTHSEYTFNVIPKCVAWCCLELGQWLGIRYPHKQLPINIRKMMTMSVFSWFIARTVWLSVPNFLSNPFFFSLQHFFLAPLWCSRHLGPCLRFSCISRYTTGASPMDHACIDPSYIGLCHVRQSSRLELQGTNFRILQYSIDHISPPLAQYTPNARSGWKLCNTNYSVTYVSQMPPNWYWT